MTAVTKQQNKKWKVKDIFFNIDEEYDTCTEAQARANELSIAKIKVMNNIEKDTDNCPADCEHCKLENSLPKPKPIEVRRTYSYCISSPGCEDDHCRCDDEEEIEINNLNFNHENSTS